MMKVIGLSFLLPGLGHLVCGQRKLGLIWLIGCNFLLFAGFSLAGYTQFDFGFKWLLGPVNLVIALPESLNFGGTLLLAQFFQSVESGGLNAEVLAWRQLGYLLSGMAGVLSIASAPHAAACVLTEMQPRGSHLPRRVHPGIAALAALLMPGLGHWIIGRKFKAKLLGGCLLGMFVLGLALGHFADFDRQRHGYYWIGQMLVGLPAWLSYLPLIPMHMEGVYPYQDTGFTFTSVAGLFNIVVALDAFHRAETDWLDQGQGQGEGQDQAAAEESSTEPGATS